MGRLRFGFGVEVGIGYVVGVLVLMGWVWRVVVRGREVRISRVGMRRMVEVQDEMLDIAVLMLEPALGGCIEVLSSGISG